MAFLDGITIGGKPSSPITPNTTPVKQSGVFLSGVTVGATVPKVTVPKIDIAKVTAPNTNDLFTKSADIYKTAGLPKSFPIPVVASNKPKQNWLDATGYQGPGSNANMFPNKPLSNTTDQSPYPVPLDMTANKIGGSMQVPAEPVPGPAVISQGKKDNFFQSILGKASEIIQPYISSFIQNFTGNPENARGGNNYPNVNLIQNLQKKGESGQPLSASDIKLWHQEAQKVRNTVSTTAGNIAMFIPFGMAEKLPLEAVKPEVEKAIQEIFPKLERYASANPGDYSANELLAQMKEANGTGKINIETQKKIQDIISKQLPGGVLSETKALIPIIDESGKIEPIVIQETKQSIAKIGPMATESALQTKLGATAVDAAKVVKIAQAEIQAAKTPVEIKQSIQQAAQKVVPTTKEKIQIFSEWQNGFKELPFGRNAEDGYANYLEEKLGRTPTTSEVKKYGKINTLTTESFGNKIPESYGGTESPLAQEATKYKSAEEFVSVEKGALNKPGITTNPEEMKAALKTKENALKAKKEYEIQLKESNDRLTSQGTKNFSIGDINARKDAADALKTIREIEGELPTKSQLTDIYNQAVKTAPEKSAKDNFIKDFNQTYNSGPSTVKTETALEKSNQEGKLTQERSDYIKLKAGEPKSYSSEDIAKYNKKALKAGQEFDKMNLESGKINTTLLTGGLDKFIEQDVVPGTKGLIENTKKIWDIVRKSLVPATRGVEARTTAAITREGLARQAREKEMLYNKLKKARSIFDKNTNEENLKFIDDIERGLDNGKFANIIHEALDKPWKEVQEIKDIDTYIQNYFPHMWKEPEKAGQKLGQFYGKRPLEGTKGYLKQRTIPYTKDGIALGLEPITYNPIELVMARIADMNRFLMANKMWTQFKEQGLRKFVSLGDKAPDGWIQVNDKIAKSFQFSEQEKGIIYRGNWYMPEPAATILNNYLSPGLRGNPIYDAFRMAGNTMNQVNLGLSAFHATFTSVDAVISKAALELQKATSGSLSIPARALAAGKFITAPIGAPIHLFNNLVRGNKLLADFYRENPQVPELVDAMMRAGGRATQDSFYKNNSMRSFLKALKSGNLPGAIIRLPMLTIETAAQPIMDMLVPRQKLGVFSDLAQYILKDAQKLGLSEMETTQRLQEAWDSVDNRMGQIVYDNLFWNKTLKDVGMLATRSLGWNLGTVRELGGSLGDFAKQGYKGVTGKGFRMTPKMGYAISLPFIAGAFGAIIYYLYNGKGPETLEDYYYPKTGRMKPDGTAERVSIPSYMKDIFAYWKEPVTTVTNKLNPIWGTMIDMLENHDYYGTEIRNINDPLVKQVQDEFAFVIKQFLPYSITGALQRKAAGGGILEQAESFFGLMPAPGYITKTSMQTDISKLYDMRFGGKISTQDQSDAAQMKSQIRIAYLQGDAATANKLLKEAVTKGYIKPAGVTTFIKDSDIPSDIRMFAGLPAEDQQGLLKKMSLTDLERYAWSSDNKQLPDTAETKQFIAGVKSGDIKSPIWKQQKNTRVDNSVYISPKSPSILNKIGTYFSAVTTNPAQSFHDIFSGQSISGTKNGAIIVERISLAESNAIKKSMMPPGGVMADYQLDHILPLEIGGTNERSNLQLLTKAQDQANNDIENYLGDALKNKKVSATKATQLMLDYKQGKITAEEIKAQIP